MHESGGFHAAVPTAAYRVFAELATELVKIRSRKIFLIDEVWNDGVPFHS